MITGERVTTRDGGFNPTYQRHVAAYRGCAPLLPAGRVLDLGCGIGHSYRELAPRESVGVDLDADALAGQDRETVVADMRRLPMGAESFDSVLSVHSLEHVSDAGAVLREVARVLAPGGRAIFVTPNRLTFGPPEEIIDPYHYVEYDADELSGACRAVFPVVEVLGLHGSPRYQRLVDIERAELDRLLALDPLRLRRLVPRRARQRLYDWRLTRARAAPLPGALEITPADFSIQAENLASALDLIAVCDLPGEPATA